MVGVLAYSVYKLKTYLSRYRDQFHILSTQIQLKMNLQLCNFSTYNCVITFQLQYIIYTILYFHTGNKLKRVKGDELATTAVDFFFVF